MPSPPLVFIVGGTGAQGLPIVEELVKDNRYAVRVLTRDSQSPRSKQLAALSKNVSFIEGSFASEQNLRAGLTGADFAFINIDGFNSGEKAELYWGIRSVRHLSLISQSCNEERELISPASDRTSWL